MQAKVKTQKLFKNPTPNKGIKKNQNYTEVPQNSQSDEIEVIIENDDIEMKDEE
jgi:hypothetical protein